MSVQPTHTHAISMLYVTTRRSLIPVSANLDTLEMENRVLVNFKFLKVFLFWF